MIEVDVQRVKRGWLQRAGRLRFVINADFESLPVSLQPDAKFFAEVSDRISHELMAVGNPVTAQQWVYTTSGWSGLLLDAWQLEHAVDWLRKLDAVHWPLDGTVVGSSRGGTGLGFLPWEPTSYIAYTTGDLMAVPPDAVPPRTARWFVEDSVTRHIVEKVQSWAYASGGRQYLGRGADWAVELADLSWVNAVAQALHQRGGASYVCRQRKPARLRVAHLRPNGRLNCQVVNPELTRLERVALVRQTLLWLPRHTDLAFIRTAPGYGTFSWSSFKFPWPHVSESQLMYNRPLLDRFTPDAHGVQVLTSAHLERAHDLSDWNVTELTSDRHLVEAPDLIPWYSEDRPDPETLAAARRDFGRMILTADDLPRDRHEL